MDVSNISNKDIYDRCLEETQKRVNQNNEFCYELLRRAFDGIDYKQIWLYVYDYLTKRVQIFCRAQGIFIDNDDLFMLSHTIITNIWKTKRESFEQDFEALENFLGYVKKATKHTVWEIYRESSRIGEYNDEVLTPNVVEERRRATNSLDERLIREGLWNEVFHIVAEIARSEQEQIRYETYLLLHFKYDYKNRDMVKEYPDLWRNDDELRVDRQRLMRHLIRRLASTGQT